MKNHYLNIGNDKYKYIDWKEDNIEITSNCEYKLFDLDGSDIVDFNTNKWILESNENSYKILQQIDDFSFDCNILGIKNIIKKNVLVCICSKYPNPFLYSCIDELYKKQINTHEDFIYKIHVVDSDSEDLIYYNQIEKDFPDIEIHMIKNKNYEYGAWKYILDLYPSFDIYFCIQDSITINKYIDLNILDNKTVYTFHHFSGYYLHLSIKELGIENLKGSGLNYNSLIDTEFNLAQHSCFIVNNIIFKDIFKHLTVPPINKDGSCFYERNFGIYFLDKDIKTINLYDFMSKINGERK